jgi:amidohydrolase
VFDLKQIRHELHKQPELSGSEKKTSEIIKKYLKACTPDNIITDLGGYGILAVFDTGRPGLSILLRAELDALPINEVNDLKYSSKNMGVSHSCGHDGHMSMLLGFAEIIKHEKSNLCGKVYLLFQPAEETAQGAKRILDESYFESLDIDYVFGLHNIPCFEKGKIILRKNVFAASSKGLIVRLKGKTSHAGQPENGNNPVLAMTGIIHGLLDISKEVESSEDISFITIIHVNLGEIAFGTSPGDGIVMATFRSTDDRKMDLMTGKSLSLIKNISDENHLKYEIEWVEIFPILINDDGCVDLIEKVAREKCFDVVFVDKPFSWTEDFSYYTQKIKGSFFGLGSGVNHPQLHNPDYDFPDDIISIGVEMFIGIVKELLSNEK